MSTAIALFDEPLRITFSNPPAADGSRVGLLMGLALTDGEMKGVCCLEDGTVTFVDAWAFSIDYRYDAQTDHFVDQNVVKPDQDETEGYPPG